jgi:hypothetical protein
VTLFHRISDGVLTISSGDCVRVATRGSAIGRVLNFSVKQARGLAPSLGPKLDLRQRD